uniref:Neur_chan_LBD domain-containing protein n=1 Tax=Angiostrongylus cantonensis TaxID=6313 RepID=A0A0K0CX15_ANGCA
MKSRTKEAMVWSLVEFWDNSDIGYTKASVYYDVIYFVMVLSTAEAFTFSIESGAVGIASYSSQDRLSINLGTGM